MNLKNVYFELIILILLSSNCFAQSWSSPLKVFGFFQASYVHISHLGGVGDRSSFNTQQLNLFFQKDLTKNWTSFVNFEILNNYSSNKQWGSMNLEEAWIKYNCRPEFTLKLGLQIPIFNNLNEIKNRTPLLPYIVRPLAYESSFGEIMNLEEMTPERAFFQVNGFIPVSKIKLDYAAYLGNSPNINNNPANGQTGVDTTDTYLFGGRLGLRVSDLKFGLSATYDKSNTYRFIEPVLNVPVRFLEKIQRIRIGSDLSYDFKSLRLESELIKVNYDDDVKELVLDKLFYYITLGYFVDEEFFIYYSYWLTQMHHNYFDIIDSLYVLKNGEFKIKVSSIGFSYHMTERITFKGQFSQVKFDIAKELPIFGHIPTENYFSTAVSVFF